MVETRAHDDYSVGWICALPKEQTAATAMLDERHGDLPKPSHDSNAYTLGSIGGHNVVIACLPKGRYGNNSATNVATLMIGTFPSIKVGLMVGIGAGIPPKVRLGDVVVSTPTNQYPGVIQWDFGKEIQGSESKRVGSLNNPPNSLLSALTKLETEHQLTGSKIPEYIEKAVQKYPKAAKRYLRSDSLTDILFQADYIHIDKPERSNEALLDGNGNLDENMEEAIEEETKTEEEEESGEEDRDACQFCNKEKVKKRKHRAMRVHYGLIASGNKVIKDGVFRDKLNKDFGGSVLCIEMEAAGLMNNFPCLVIRGICDYADSHKNKAWQEHAAAVAAAFAKELLSFVQSSDVQGERPVAAILDEIKHDIHHVHQLIEKKFVETKEDLSNLRDDNTIEKKEKILNWLSPIDFFLQHHDYMTKCEPGTGQWLLDSTEVNKWLDKESQTLFCSGVPGAGKTFQTSILANHLLNKFRGNNKISVALLYHNYQQQDKKAEYFLSNLIKQFARNLNPLPATVQELYDKQQRESTGPLLKDLSETLVSLIASFSRVFILIDALDEYENHDSQTKLLDQLFTIQEKTNLNLFATSRPIPRITKRFEFGECSRREIAPSRHDIFHFLDSRMSELPDFVAGDAALQNEIKTSIESSIEGMFLLAPLYIDSLIGKRSPAALRTALKSLRRPSARSSNGLSPLYEAYDKAMERIQRQRGDLPHDALLILSWIVKAQRQLTVPELKEAIAVEIGKSELDEDNIPTIDHMIQACAPLIVVDRESNIVRLVHYTTQEYFEQPHNIWMREAHIKITNICMTYMSFPAFQDSFLSYYYKYRFTIKGNFLYGYASRYWEYHTHKALAQGLDVSKVVEFLERVKEDSWYQLLIHRYLLDGDQREFLTIYYSLPTRLTALHIAACLGLYDVAVKLLEKGYDPNAKDSSLRTSLWWAARNGHSQVVELLLELDVDLETNDNKDFETPLLTATIRGHEVVVKLLLDKGANLESRSGSEPTVILGTKPTRTSSSRPSLSQLKVFGLTPLAWAVESGYESITNLLIAKNANIDAQDYRGLTMLTRAIIDRNEARVKFLLARGANQEIEDRYGYTPLCHAVYMSQIGLTKLLINNGANLKPRTSNRTTVLHIAIRRMSEVISLLLKANAFDVNAIDCYGYTPLSYATQYRRRNALAALLVSKEVDVELTDKFGKSPIMYAKERGDAELLQMLLRYKHSKDNGSGHDGFEGGDSEEAQSKHRLSTDDTYESPAKRRLLEIG